MRTGDRADKNSHQGSGSQRPARAWSLDALDPEVTAAFRNTALSVWESIDEESGSALLEVPACSSHRQTSDGRCTATVGIDFDGNGSYDRVGASAPISSG